MTVLRINVQFELCKPIKIPQMNNSEKKIYVHQKVIPLQECQDACHKILKCSTYLFIEYKNLVASYHTHHILLVLKTTTVTSVWNCFLLVKWTVVATAFLSILCNAWNIYCGSEADLSRKYFNLECRYFDDIIFVFFSVWKLKLPSLILM